MKVLSSTFDMQSKQIDNVATPSIATDAANKSYVDGKSFVVSVSVTSPITNTGTSTAPIIGFNPNVDLSLNVAQSIQVTDSATGITNVLTISHNTTGTPSTNLGTAILFQGETDTSTDQTMAQILASWSNVAQATRSAYIDLRTSLNGTLSTAMRLHPSNGVSINNTVDPGAGFVNVPTAGGYKINNQPLSVDDIAATTTNDTAPTGKVGETISSAITNAARGANTNNVAKNVTSIVLTAGDWDVRGNVGFQYTTMPVNSASQLSGQISQTSATIPDDGYQAYGQIINPTGVTATLYSSVPLPPRRISLASTTTIYLVSQMSGAGGTLQSFGFIQARRVR